MRISKISSFFTLLFLYFYSQLLNADTKVELQPVTVEESGFTVDIYNPIIPITIITKDDISQKQPINTFALLNKIPGINIDRSSSRGNISSIFFRNAEANFTSIYIDGIKVNNPTNSRGGGYNFSLLDVNSINQIEIAKGPASSISGSDTLAGVINISTFTSISDSDDNKNRLDINHGSGGYYNFSLRAGNILGNYEYDLYASNSNDGVPNDGSNFKLDTLNFLIRKEENNSSLKFKINSTNSFSSYFPDDSGGILFSEKRDLEYKKSHGSGASINFKKKFNDLINYNLQASYYYEQEDLKSPGVNPGVGNASGISKNSSDSRYSIYGLSLKNNFKLSNNLNIDVGFDMETGKSIIDSSVAGSLSKDSRKRTTYSPFISAKYNVLRNVIFLSSFSFNFTDDFEENISPKIGLSYNFSKSTVASISWGKGFKLPSFYSLGNALVGNSELVPEKSEGAEFNLSGRSNSNKFQYSLNLFSVEYKNLIDFDAATFTLVNRSKLNTNGFELLAKYSFLDRFSIQSYATYIHSDLDVAGTALRHRPDWKGGIVFQWDIKPNFYFNLDSNFTDDRYDSSVVTGNRVLSSHTKFDLSTHYQFNSNIHFNFSIDNLFDRNYQESIGFLARGITPKASLTIKF